MRKLLRVGPFRMRKLIEKILNKQFVWYKCKKVLPKNILKRPNLHRIYISEPRRGIKVFLKCIPGLFPMNFLSENYPNPWNLSHFRTGKIFVRFLLLLQGSATFTLRSRGKVAKQCRIFLVRSPTPNFYFAMVRVFFPQDPLNIAITY